MLPLFASIAAMIAIVGIRYLAVSGGFAWATRRVHPGLYGSERIRRQIRREIGWSLLTAAIYAVPAGAVAYAWDKLGWTLIYRDPAAYPLWWLPLSVAIYLFAHDSWFYWTHRLMHRPSLFRLMHAVHHNSRPPTAWAAMSFHPLEALSGAFLIPALVFVVPIHWAALAVVLTVATVFGVTNHLGWEIFPKSWLSGPFGKVMITASHHDRHHSSYRSNFGLYFRFWDRLCGTDGGLSETLAAAGGHRGTGTDRG